jgi:hypothetical protein
MGDRDVGQYCTAGIHRQHGNTGIRIQTQDRRIESFEFETPPESQ